MTNGIPKAVRYMFNIPSLWFYEYELIDEVSDVSWELTEAEESLSRSDVFPRRRAYVKGSGGHGGCDFACVLQLIWRVRHDRVCRGLVGGQ